MHLTVECPHCGSDQNEQPEFNMLSADDLGVDSGHYKRRCYDCDKEFWFKARCNFDVEVLDVYKKQPKKKVKNAQV